MSVKLIKPIIWILLITSCYTSVITNSWHSENNTQKVYKKILVVALVNSKSYLLLTENMENHLAADLNEKGITSISSFKVYGPKAFNGLTENEVLNKIEKKDIDAVLTIVLLDKETINKDEIAQIFSKVKAWPRRPAWTGSATRIPSDQPPVDVPAKAVVEVEPAKKVSKRKPKSE